jgi:hypothetical protein
MIVVAVYNVIALTVIQCNQRWRPHSYILVTMVVQRGREVA